MQQSLWIGFEFWVDGREYKSALYHGKTLEDLLKKMGDRIRDAYNNKQKWEKDIFCTDDEGLCHAQIQEINF